MKRHRFVSAKNSYPILFFVLSLLFLLLLDSFLDFSTQCETIRENVLRLHIVAHSDEEMDQQQKLLVRDRILQEAQDFFESADSFASAREAAEKRLPQLEAIARKELQRLGSHREVHAELTTMFFPTRSYEDFTMPAGVYDAVRITIGEAQGHNWWCVLYPTLCLPAAVENKEAALAQVLTPEQRKIVLSTSRYEVRFYALEWLEKLKNRWD